MKMYLKKETQIAGKWKTIGIENARECMSAAGNFFTLEFVI